jgi:hypothetical protein
MNSVNNEELPNMAYTKFVYQTQTLRFLFAFKDWNDTTAH